MRVPTELLIEGTTEMVNQRRGQWQEKAIARALERARRRGVCVTGKGVRRRDGAHVYTVSSGSAPGLWHLVVVAGRRLVCDCAAGQYGRLCVHRAVVHERIAAERATGWRAASEGPEGGDAA